MKNITSIRENERINNAIEDLKYNIKVTKGSEKILYQTQLAQLISEIARIDELNIIKEERREF